MNGQIFISYRREDASYPAGRLYDNLHSRFPENEIFMDVDSIKPGIDFVETIEERVSSCDVLVAVIGKRWLSAADEEGRRRLDNPEDFVRVEVGTALKRGVRVIPVLVEGALMPPASQLPEGLKPLARRNALNVSHDRFRADSERLIDSVGEVLEAARVERPPRPPEGQLRRGPVAGQGKTEAPQGMGADSRVLPSDRTPLKGVTAKLKRPRRLLVVLGIGVVVCLLGVGLFKATRPQPVSIGGSSSPTPAPLAAALNSPSPTPLVSQVSPSPSPSGAEGFTEAKHYLDLGDYAKALSPLQKAADAGDAVAMNSLGYLYEKGLGVAQDYAQARQWFQKAAEAGNYHAMEHLGYLYEHGLGVAQDYAQARQWYQKAADAGNAGARQALARLASAPSSTSSAAESLAQAQRYLDTKDFANALPLLQKAAAGGNTSAMNKLGDLYYDGKGVAQDYGKSREWYQKAADAGNAVAMTNLGWLYENGKGVAQDYDKAREWYQKGGDAGNTDAMYNLGVLYRDGKGVAQDYDKAREWYQKAADAGNTDAKQALSELPSISSPIPASSTSPVSQASLSHSPSGAEALAEAKRYFAAKDYAHALPPLQKAAEAGNAWAMTNLGWLYESGRGGLPKDDAQAVSWYQKAAEAGDALGMACLGVMYENGRGGLPKDDAQAVSWFQKAAEAGDAHGMANLGFMYANGRGGLPKDDARAVSWYQKAAEAGDALGMSNLGFMYENGRGGLPKDDAQAVSWFQKAAEAGDAHGMANLGLMYEAGRGGLPKDNAQAVSWYQKAADAGNAWAKNALLRLHSK